MNFATINLISVSYKSTNRHILKCKTSAIRFLYVGVANYSWTHSIPSIPQPANTNAYNRIITLVLTSSTRLCSRLNGGIAWNARNDVAPFARYSAGDEQDVNDIECGCPGARIPVK